MDHESLGFQHINKVKLVIVLIDSNFEKHDNYKFKL